MANKNNNKSGDLGFEATLWATADKLRGNLDAAEYKHVVLGLIFLKYISDAFAEKHAALQAEKGADPEDRDEYLAENIFWVPQEARWWFIQGRAKRPAIGTDLDLAMVAIRSIEGNLGAEPADSFHRELHKDLKADFILANPPFNNSDWGGDRLREDPRWKYGVPPAGNANFAWVQHFIHHLAPTGTAGFVLANGSLSSNHSGEGDIRQAIVEADLVDCMVALPGQLFYSTQIPVCLWFLARDKRGGAGPVRSHRDRRGHTLFLDARKLGTRIDRVQKDLTEDDIQKLADTYHAWRGDKGAGKYADIAGFCKEATTAEIAAHSHVLTPGRYVGAEDVEDDGEPFDQKMPRLIAELNAQFEESAKLEKAIRLNLKGLGF